MSDLPVLETERLVLRPFSFADARDVQRLAGDKEISRFNPVIPHPYEDGVAEAWIAAQEEDFGLKKSMTLAITLKASGSLAGVVSLLNMSPGQSRAELGYWVGKEYWNNGFASEAARSMMEYGFQILKLHRIFAGCLRGNKPSARVMEKIGMVYEGCRREHECREGHFEDILTYGILCAEWNSLQTTGSALQTHSPL